MYSLHVNRTCVDTPIRLSYNRRGIGGVCHRPRGVSLVSPCASTSPHGPAALSADSGQLDGNTVDPVFEGGALCLKS